jgi:outer membrane protein OmpA-like peptidoglycan-associated protein
MKKTLFVISTVLMLINQKTHAQRLFGLANSNYAGMNGVNFNPGNIADNRLLMDLQFFNVNGFVNQNYGYFKKIGDLTSGDGDLIRTNTTKPVGFNALGDLKGPSVTFQVGKKSGFSFHTRFRTTASGAGISQDFFTLVNDGIRDLRLANGTQFTSGKTSINVHAFGEIGIGYGREILNKGKHFLKGGIILKRYSGIGAASFNADNFSVKLLDTSISKVEYNGSFKISQTYENDLLDERNISVSKALFNGAGSGLGIDIGFVYEHRNFDEENPLSTSRVDNKYDYKIGFTVQDLGSIRYKASANNNSFLVNTNGPRVVSRADTANLAFDDLSSYFRSIPGVTSTQNKDAFKVSAPTILTAYFDYKIKKHIYVNGLITTGIVGKTKAGTTNPLQVVVTPRFESVLFDAGLPIGYNNLSNNITAGLGLRLGILYFGSDDIITNLFGKVKGLNAYAGLHAGIPYRKKKIKEAKIDDEPVVAQTKTADTPEAPKDTDGDGVNDDEDKCFRVPGVAKYQGCPIPDTDGDGINDDDDKCVKEKGVAKYQGCPVPDTDADGINDEEDKCINEKGIAKYQGCPIPDADGDGVNDDEDKCIDKPGFKENAGCPKIEAAVTKKLEFAAKAIQFEVGKDIIKSISFKKLDEVVKVLNEYPDYNLTIEGHTDNTGKKDKNQTLSENRAAAVKAYFVKKGIAAERLTATGYGDSQPLIANTTLANKAKNRRVELKMALK